MRIWESLFMKVLARQVSKLPSLHTPSRTQVVPVVRSHSFLDLKAASYSFPNYCRDFLPYAADCSHASSPM